MASHRSKRISALLRIFTDAVGNAQRAVAQRVFGHEIFKIPIVLEAFGLGLGKVRLKDRADFGDHLVKRAHNCLICGKPATFAVRVFRFDQTLAQENRQIEQNLIINAAEPELELPEIAISPRVEAALLEIGFYFRDQFHIRITLKAVGSYNNSP